MHLMHRYEEISSYMDKESTSKGSFLGIMEARYSLTDMVERRYDELLDLEVPERTNMGLDDLLDMDTFEFRHLLQRFRKLAKEKSEHLKKAASAVEKARNRLNNTTRN